MPSASQAQAHFMAMSRTAAGRAKLRSYGKKPAPASVAKEFTDADRGRKIGRLAKHVRRKE